MDFHYSSTYTRQKLEVSFNRMQTLIQSGVICVVSKIRCLWLDLIRALLILKQDIDYLQISSHLLSS